MLDGNPAEWQSTLDDMRLRNLWYLKEITQLEMSVGLPSGRYKEQQHLTSLIKRHLDHVYKLIYNHPAPRPTGWIDYEGYGHWVVIWDHWQDNLKSLVCGLPTEILRRDEQLWDDNSGDELLIKQEKDRPKRHTYYALGGYNDNPTYHNFPTQQAHEYAPAFPRPRFHPPS